MASPAFNPATDLVPVSAAPAVPAAAPAQNSGLQQAPATFNPATDLTPVQSEPASTTQPPFDYNHSIYKLFGIPQAQAQQDVAKLQNYQNAKQAMEDEIAEGTTHIPFTNTSVAQALMGLKDKLMGTSTGTQIAENEAQHPIASDIGSGIGTGAQLITGGAGLAARRALAAKMAQLQDAGFTNVTPKATTSAGTALANAAGKGWSYVKKEPLGVILGTSEIYDKIKHLIGDDD